MSKVWGREIWIVNNNLYCCKILQLNKGYICSHHMHRIKDETFYVLSGVVFMKRNDIEFFMEKGDPPVRIRPGEYHSFLGIHYSEILEVSTQHFEDDSYRKDISRELDSDEYNRYLKKFNRRGRLNESNETKNRGNA